MIVVVLPAYNESEAMPRLLGRLLTVRPMLPGPVAVLVVDDGSTDATAEIAEGLSCESLPIRVIRHSRNRGLHGAMDTGLRAAAAECPGGDDWIVVMDADDTHPPDLIPGMIQQGGDVVIASRFQDGAEWHGKTWDRILFSYGVSYLYQWAWPMNGVRDYTCGYRAYRADLMRRALASWGEEFVSESSFACMPDILWKLGQFNPVIREVPLALHYDRKPGPSKMNVSRTIWRTLVLLVKRRLAPGRPRT